jgi:hypothetical protein
MIKRISILSGILIFSGAIYFTFAEGKEHDDKSMKHHEMMHHNHQTNDERISLNMPPQMKQHQLANMRSHLAAVQTIIQLIADEKFELASKEAHEKLGLTEEMKNMCNMFEDENYRSLGFAFHKSGDELGKILLKKNAKKSLQALGKTMDYCVQCHATYRQ